MDLTNHTSDHQTLFPESKVKTEEKRNFLRCKFSYGIIVKEDKHDPLVKRENFAISLRKKKKEEILKQKRSRLAISDTSEYFYSDCPLFSFAGLIPSHQYRAGRINLKEILLRIAPFFAQNFANDTE